MDPVTFLGTALIVSAAATLQSAVGFGMALVVIPLLLWTGTPLPEAIATLLGAALVQTGYGIFVGRRHLRWKPALKLGAIQWAAIPVGVAAIHAVSDATTIRQIVGIAVVAMVTLKVLASPTPRPSVGAGWSVAAAGSSGVLAGSIGIGGPPLVIYALSHDWPKQEFRVFLWTQFLLAQPMLLAMLTIRSGSSIWSAYLLGVACAPFLWLGSSGGLRLSHRWSDAGLQRAAVVLLYAIGLAAIAAI